MCAIITYGSVSFIFGLTLAFPVKEYGNNRGSVTDYFLRLRWSIFFRARLELDETLRIFGCMRV